MSDSLRDQLMKAGFKENPATKKNNAKKQARSQAGSRVSSQANKGAHKGQSTNHRGGSGQNPAAARKHQAEKKQQAKAEFEKAEAARIASKKAIKQQIKTLIETDCIKDHAGAVAYSYQLGTRVKQLFVKEEHQKKLAAGELLITRLNGNTYLVPTLTGSQIIALNPDWAMVGGEYNSAGVAEEDSEYAEYQIPDDLTW